MEETIDQLVNSALLEPIAIISAPAADTFSVVDRYRVGETEGVAICWVREEFESCFENMTENHVPPQSLRIHRLRKVSHSAPIIAELGGKEMAATYLATIWEMMKKQGHGEEGDLLVGLSNIFYVCDNEGILRVVSCSWRALYGGWSIDAYPVNSPIMFGEDDLVFSC